MDEYGICKFAQIGHMFIREINQYSVLYTDSYYHCLENQK